MAILYGRAGRLTAQNGGFRPGQWSGLAVKAPKRSGSEHITVTVVLYNTVAGGVPSAADVAAAVDDMEALYASCSASGRLADASFAFMKSELTVADAGAIQAKLATQPYAPPPVGVAGFDAFPINKRSGG